VKKRDHEKFSCTKKKTMAMLCVRGKCLSSPTTGAIATGVLSMALPEDRLAMSAPAIASNALNFQSFVQHGVDPRTGQYTMSFAIPPLKNNVLSGPDLPLTLSFSPMNTTDSGFGVGWSINLSEYAPQTRMLSLSTGESFKVQQTGEQLTVEEQKLDSFHFHALGNDRWRVVHRSGLVEILHSESIDGHALALPEQLLGADGRSIDVAYAMYKGRRCLESISDPSGVLLQVTRNTVTDDVELLLFPGHGPDGEPLARFLLELNTYSQVTRIELPTDEGAGWTLGYDDIRGYTCLKDVWTPGGTHEVMTYGDQGHVFPGDKLPNLPRVTRHLVDPGQEQPPIDVEYQYSNENFLGQGALSDWYDNGLDNLYRVASITFKYYSFARLKVDGAVAREVKRVYNRFHLMTEETTTQGVCEKQVITTYHAEDGDNLYLQFEQQPAYCQMPLYVDTHWRLTNDSTQHRTERTESRYDDHGNLILQVNSDGTREELEYYSADGEGDLCPADPEGFVRNLRTRIAHPSPAGRNNPPPLRTTYTYRDLDPVPGPYSRKFLLEHSQTLSEGDGPPLRHTVTEYYDDPADRVQFGRMRSVGETLNDHTSFTDYQYATGDGRRFGERTLDITETLTGFDHTSQTVTQQHSLRTGETLMMRGLDGIEMLRQYDALNRVISETVAPDTDYAASRTYAYHLVGGTGGDKAWQLTTDVRGVQTRTWYDGMSRVILEECQDMDAAVARGLPADQAVFRRTYTASFNALDQRVEATDYDWLDEVELPLTTQHAFDDWGTRRRIVNPDRVVEISEMSPFGTQGPVERRWVESADDPSDIRHRRVLHYNRFGKTWLEEELDEEEKVTFALRKAFDGLGQCVESREQFENRDLATEFAYDAWRRLVSTTLPDGTVITRRLAAHSSEELPVELRAKPANVALPEVVAGEQAFDGVERLIARTVGGRTNRYRYAGGELQPDRRTTPAGNEIEIDYERPLGDAPGTVTAPEESTTYQYDHLSGTVLAAANEEGTRSYAYAYTGAVSRESWRGTGGETHISDHSVSRMGRPLQRRDSSSPGARYALTTTVHHDDRGRPEWTEQGVVRATTLYDGFGAPRRTTTHNALTDETLVTEQQYDSAGREVLRTLTVGSQVFTVDQQWRGDGKLTHRHLKQGARSLLDEAFHYDLRGRLQRHECKGEQQPEDSYGNRISQQVFSYDVLDNITRCVTSFADGSRDDAVMTHATADPCQLVQITHTHASYPDMEQFEYDEDGNLLSDTGGEQLTYDSLGRLLTHAYAGGQTAYHYDGHAELAGLRDGNGTETLLFHDGYQIHHTVQDAQVLEVLHANGQAVAQTSTPDPAQARLLLTTAIGSVIGEARQGQLTTTGYSAYGENGDALAALLGYNGERREASGWYLLGRGYRAYSPRLKRFNRPDSMAPFDGGGLNPYAYCGGDPVRFRDPSGHVRDVPEYYYPPPPPKSSGAGGGWLKWLGVAVAGVFMAVSIVTAPWAAGVGSAVMMTAVKGIAIQAAGIGLSVAANLIEDPTLQMVAMVGSMALGMWGGSMAGSASSKAAAAVIKPQKQVQPSMPVFESGWTSNKIVSIPRAKAPNASTGARNVTGNTGTPPGPQNLATGSPTAARTGIHLPRAKAGARNPLARAPLDGLTYEELKRWNALEGLRSGPYQGSAMERFVLLTT
jgi:RHS repeat-associated protein